VVGSIRTSSDICQKLDEIKKVSLDTKSVYFIISIVIDMSHSLLSTSSVVTAQLRSDIPDFTPGAVVQVHYKIVESGKERIQVFEGIVTQKQHGKGINGTFTVLKVASNAIKVERTFPLHSPMIAKVVVVTSQRGRRANLAYLHNLKDPQKSIRGRAVTRV